MVADIVRTVEPLAVFPATGPVAMIASAQLAAAPIAVASVASAPVAVAPIATSAVAPGGNTVVAAATQARWAPIAATNSIAAPRAAAIADASSASISIATTFASISAAPVTQSWAATAPVAQVRTAVIAAAQVAATAAIDALEGAGVFAPVAATQVPADVIGIAANAGAARSWASAIAIPAATTSTVAELPVGAIAAAAPDAAFDAGRLIAAADRVVSGPARSAGQCRANVEISARRILSIAGAAQAVVVVVHCAAAPARTAILQRRTPVVAAAPQTGATTIRTVACRAILPIAAGRKVQEIADLVIRGPPTASIEAISRAGAVDCRAIRELLREGRRVLPSSSGVSPIAAVAESITLIHCVRAALAATSARIAQLLGPICPTNRAIVAVAWARVYARHVAD
jgi:hypothetical protein